jgi:hypothetical protein
MKNQRELANLQTNRCIIQLTSAELNEMGLVGMAIEAGRAALVGTLLTAGAIPTEDDCLLAADHRDPALIALLDFDFSSELAANSDHTLLKRFGSADCALLPTALDCLRAVRPDQLPIQSLVPDLAQVIKGMKDQSDINSVIEPLIYSLFFSSSLREVNRAIRWLPAELQKAGVTSEQSNLCYQVALSAYEAIQRSGHLIARPLSPAHQKEMATAYSKHNNFCRLQSEFMHRRSSVYQEALALLASGKLSTLEELTYHLSTDRTGLNVKMRRQMSGLMNGLKTTLFDAEQPTLRYGQFAPLIQDVIGRLAANPDYHPGLSYSQSNRSYTVLYTLESGTSLPLTTVIWDRDPVLIEINHAVGDLSELIDEAESRFQSLLEADRIESNELATLYWILCQLTLKINGSAQSSLETHNLLRELKGLPVYPVSRETYLLDVLALVLPLDIFLSIYDDCFDRPESATTFDPIVHRGYLEVR